MIKTARRSVMLTVLHVFFVSYKLSFM